MPLHGCYHFRVLLNQGESVSKLTHFPAKHREIISKPMGKLLSLWQIQKHVLICNDCKTLKVALHTTSTFYNCIISLFFICAYVSTGLGVTWLSRPLTETAVVELYIFGHLGCILTYIQRVSNVHKATCSRQLQSSYCRQSSNLGPSDRQSCALQLSCAAAIHIVILSFLNVIMKKFHFCFTGRNISLLNTTHVK